MFYIFILLLQLGKYYIGQTTKYNFNLNNTNIYLNDWTFKYKPIKLVDFISNVNEADVDKYTLHYMNIHGLKNVRGGQYYQFNLSNEQINTIESSINCEIQKNTTIYNTNQKNFLEKIKNLPIDDTISKLTQLINKIDNLNKVIELTNIININNINDIKQEIKNIKILHEIQTNTNNLYKIKKVTSTNLRHNNKEITDIELKLSNLKEKYPEIINTHVNTEWTSKINKIIYELKFIKNINSSYDIFENYYYDEEINNYISISSNDLLMNTFQIIKLNIESNIKLNDIYKKYYNREFVIDILEILYRKEINKLIK